MKRIVLLVFAFSALLILCGCTADRIYLQEQQELGWYPTKIENELAGQDPAEGWNRSMFMVTDCIMDYFADPVARVYGSIMPKPGIDCIENACQNLEFPAKFFSCLGSAEWKGAGDEFLRFLINSTIGIAGLFDPAEHWFHIYSTNSDFGQMFAKWGIGPGCTFLLPMSPKTNVRDQIGFIFDCAFDIRTYLPYTYLATLNRFVVGQQAYAPVVDGSADRYKTYRQMMAVYREMQLARYLYHRQNEMKKEYAAAQKDGVMPVKFKKDLPAVSGLRGSWIPQKNYFPQTPYLESLRGVLTTPEKANDFWYIPHTLFNSDFYRKIDVRKLKRPDGIPSARYAFFAQDLPEDENAPLPPQKLAILIPGMGGSYDGKSTLAIAELYYNAGYDVIAIDSNFYWRGMERGAGAGKLPGYAPEDAKRINAYLLEIMEDLKKDGLLRDKIVWSVLTGWSYGALSAAHMMKENPLKIDRCILINPPADLAYAMKALDGGMKETVNWSAEEIRSRIPRVVGSMLITSSLFLPAVDEKDSEDWNPMKAALFLPRVEEREARYISAVSLRSNIRDVIFKQHEKKALPRLKNNSDWVNRNSLYDEIDRIDFVRYAKEFLMPELDAKMTYAELERAAGLYPLEKTLQQKNIYCLHNWNDFLLSPADRIWLDKTLKERMVWFDAGGHLGNLYMKVFRDKLMDVSGKK